MIFFLFHSKAISYEALARDILEAWIWTKHQFYVVKLVFTRSLLGFSYIHAYINVLGFLLMWGDLFSRDHYLELPRTYRKKEPFWVGWKVQSLWIERKEERRQKEKNLRKKLGRKKIPLAHWAGQNGRRILLALTGKVKSLL